MKKFFARLKALFSNPENDIMKIMPSLDRLKLQMEYINEMPNKVKAIVKLFEIISQYQDAGGFKQTIFKLQEKNYGQLDKIILALETLQKHFANAGRSEFGMNRTKAGEKVTAAKVYLGDVFGIWTNTAEYWLSKEEELKKDEREDLTKENAEKPVTTWYCINDYQAGRFVKSHVEGIFKQINILQTV